MLPKCTTFCMLVEYKIGKNFPCGIKFKFEIEFELKILETELNLKLISIYWGNQLVWKNLINSTKFLFDLLFQNRNLDWHDRMVRFEVSINALIDLV
jgi:hypothetical protein